MGGSNKKVTVGYKYYLGMHMILSHGPIDCVKWFKVDDRIAWHGSATGGTVSVEADELFGGDSREGGVSGLVDVEMGKPTQGQNSYLITQLGSDIPSFRGVAGVVLRQCYLGNNPYLKKWSFRQQRVYVRQDDLEQWYAPKAAIEGSYITPDATWQYQITTNALPVPAIPSGGWSDGAGAFGRMSPNNPFTPPFSIHTSWPQNTALWLQKTITCSGLVPIRLMGQYENAVFVYWDGTLVGSFNPTNVDISGLPAFEVNIPTTLATRGDHTINLYALDDFVDFGDSDNTYLYIEAPGQIDMNPAHIIRECLTDPDWGMGYAESDIDDTAFQAAADTLYDELMGISLIWDRQVAIEGFIAEIIKHIDATLYVDRTTGKFVLKLIRDDYDEGTLPLFNESNIDKIENFSRPTFGELTNSVTVNYWDADTGKTASLSVQDTALIQMQGAVINTTVQYPGFTNLTIASRVGLRDLRTLSTPLINCTLYANQDASALNIGDAFKLSWDDYGIDNVIMRVTGLAFGDGRKNQIRITASQDQFATPADGTLVEPEDGFEDIGGAPTAADDRLVLESPYYEWIQSLGQTYTDDTLSSAPDIGYVLAAASRPTNALNAILATDSGPGYEELSVLDFCPSAELAADIDPLDTAITIQNGSDLDLVTIGTHCQIEQEICRVDAIDEVAGTMTIGRGCLDTTPTSHTTADVIFFWDVYSQNDPTEYVDSETINVKILPMTTLGKLSLAAAPADSVVMNSRAIRPYPPGQFKLDGVYYPALVASSAFNVTWAHRDRVQQTAGTIIDHTSGNIGPEAGTTYRLEIYNESDGLEQTISSISGTTQAVDLSSLPTEFATIKLYSVRGGYDSWQSAEHFFEYTIATQFVVLPLTYDEVDYDTTMTWTRQGDSPHVTPGGFEGDGWNARMTSDTIPTWMNSAGKKMVTHASISFFDERPMNASGDTVLYVGEDAAGVSPDPTYAFKVLQEPEDVTRAYLEFQTMATTLRQLPLCRPNWKYQFRFPVLTVGAYEVRPQAIYFIDATTVLVAGHYQDTESIVYQIDLTDHSVDGSFTFGTSTHRHIAAIAVDSGGNLWMTDYETHHTLQINLTSSLSGGTAVISADWDTSVLTGLGAIAFVNVSGTDYVLLQEHATSGTPYLYVVAESEMGDGLTFAVGDRYKRFSAGLRAQGISIDGSGNLWISKNVDAATSTTLGWMEDYGSASSLISGTSDGGTISPSASYPGPSQYVEDIDFHPSTGELWTLTEGWQSVGDYDGWLGIWSSPADDSIVVNHVTSFYDAAGSLTLRLNNEDFQTESWTPTQVQEIVSVGGPPQATEEFVNGFFKGYIKNIRLQNKDFEGTDYSDTIGGTTYEPNTLTEFTITMTNPGAESGSTTGWTNETGSLGTRTANPVPYEGSYYFMGGANAATTARQRFDLLTETGLTGGEVDAGGIWAKVRWHQASYTDQDPVTMGIRMLDSGPSQLSLTYAHKDWVPDGNSGATQNWRSIALGVDIPSGTRNIDAVYDASRTSGTNLDGYVDSISLTIYQQ